MNRIIGAGQAVFSGIFGVPARLAVSLRSARIVQTTFERCMMRISKLRLAIVGVTGAVIFAGAGAGVAYAFQPHMQVARGDLQTSQRELAAAIPDKAGHRVAAQNLVQQAIDQVNLGIQAGAQ